MVVRYDLLKLNKINKRQALFVEMRNFIRLARKNREAGILEDWYQDHLRLPWSFFESTDTIIKCCEMVIEDYRLKQQRYSEIIVNDMDSLYGLLYASLRHHLKHQGDVKHDPLVRQEVHDTNLPIYEPMIETGFYKAIENIFKNRKDYSSLLSAIRSKCVKQKWLKNEKL